MPGLACPQQCSFCNQNQISGHSGFPDVEEIKMKIETHLASFTAHDREVEIAFFGGTFTGLPSKIQEKYLSIARPYVESGAVKGLRISTRPDYIDEENLQLLKYFGVNTIELGAQSLDDEVLLRCNRGHTSGDVTLASEMIIRYGFTLGLQMMIGLPGDSPQKSMATAQKIIALGARETRIYPCLVINDTELAKEYANGLFTPFDLEIAIRLSAELVQLFEKAEVKVIRLGLHRSEELQAGAMIAGPYHNSFKELVMTEIWNRILITGVNEIQSESIHIHVKPTELNFAVGYQAKNKNMLLNKFRQVKFSGDTNIVGRDFYINTI
jgi:histone acetyltransferase (RNA polymerase elongator complex component)